ncbi:MAG: hypothetical protein OEZ38_12160 [Gammaproteobacteria bacterium]|nr:hypothetical protein [Gammaproteobacteria bacterium]
MDPLCYSQRLLNPFRGVMNVIEYEGAQAVSTDGLHWDIYVRDNELVKDLANSHMVQTSDIRYGSWSKANGLRRGAIYPSEDFKLLENQGAIVYEFLLKHCDEVPFPLKDYFELWLLDDKQQPLALLSSVIRKKDREFDIPLCWRSGIICKKSFYSSVIEVLASEHIHPADYICHYINHFADQNPVAQWFFRDELGDARGMEGINLKPELINRRLDQSLFPVFYIKDYGHDQPHEKLVNDFLAWQAPYFLLLHDLDDKTRSQLEHQAKQRALILDQLHHLYPAIINQDIINAARVEALLRQHNNSGIETEDTSDTDYTELNISRTN